MNYLAHSYLSYSEGQIAGNFLEDFVRNRERQAYPQEILKGIRLHREIDHFTDHHPIISEAKTIFQPFVRLYSGAFVDIAMDYFLANDPTKKTQKQWEIHSAKVYEALEKHHRWLPETLALLLPKIKEDNWLLNYRYDWGIEYSFRHIARKAKYLDSSEEAFSAFLHHKPFLQTCYEAFFPELEAFCHRLNENEK